MIQLESTKLFSGLSQNEIALVRNAAREIAFAPNQPIFVEGDPGDGIYLVKRGLVQISAVLNVGERVVLTRLGAGELFGEMAVLDQNPRSASATAEEPTEVYFIPRDELLQILESIPRLSAFFVREISRRLRDFNGQYIREVLQSERLALVGRFASSIVHDLKNPLNIIGLAAEMAGTETASPEMRATSKKRIAKQVQRISDMVNELLEFARGSQPAMELTKTEYASFVENLIEEIRPEAEMKSVRIEFEKIPPKILVRINCARLSRVFHNLIHNAIDVMPDGGKIVLRFSLNKNEVVTEVEDSGSGIAPEMANKLFQPFATHGKSHGTGLGLSICKRIVEDHKGKIYARSEPQHGAIFGFTLPIEQP
ncbi:MAG: ATP-binding protein [Verrucomicrobiota bacterium]